MDIVFVCRAAQQNEELRFSLRSLVNLPHDRVWIAGGWPRWVRGVMTIAVESRPTKYEATTANLLAACRAGVSERFVLMNDDMFVMRPMDGVPTLHRGPIDDVARAHSHSSYAGRMQLLAEWLRERGYGDLSYELHAPMVIDRDRMLEVLALDVPPPVRDPHKRSLYGNVMRLGGEQTVDCKVFGAQSPWDPTWPFLSTNDHSFAGRVGRHIRAAFPDPGPYERSSP